MTGSLSGQRPSATTLLAVLTGVLAITVPSAASAQAPAPRRSFAVGANAGYYVLSGKDFRPTDNAPGIEVYGAMEMQTGLQIGIGGHYSSHGTFIDDNLVITSVFVEPRLIFDTGKGTHTFLGARVGFVHRTIKPASTRFSSSGYGLGVLAGINYAISESLEIEGSATLDRVSLASLGGGSERDTGQILGFRAGVRIPLR